MNQTEITRRRYQRNSRFYDWMEAMGRGRLKEWRKLIWSQIEGPDVLEVGVGTGVNIEYYPSRLSVTAIDLTPGMLKRAVQRARKLAKQVDLQLGDVQDLKFRRASFDTAVATCVFCSVPDPVKGLKEIRRVMKPGGKLYLLEHMRSEKSWIGKMMDFLNPLVVRMMGANINRRTLENIKLAGFALDQVVSLDRLGIFRIVVAKS